MCRGFFIFGPMNNCTIDQDICRQLGQIIKSYSFRTDFYTRHFLHLEAQEETKFRAYFFSVLICHQTYALKSEKRQLFGWEFLEYVFAKLAENDSPLLDPAFMLKVGAKHLAYLIKPLFSDTLLPNDSTLDRIEERIGLMIDAAKIIELEYDGRVGSIFDQELLFHNSEGVYERLEKMEGFADPLRKKSSFLLKLLSDAALYSPKDPQNLVPIMDYHMQRVLLRSGALRINDTSLAQKLRHKIPIETDLEIRTAAIEAMRIIARESTYDVLKMNDIFYLLGRSCCLDDPLCKSGKCAKTPCSLTNALELPAHKSCIFQDVCLAAADDNFIDYWQPIVETHYY